MNIGVIGSGFMAKGLVTVLESIGNSVGDVEVSTVLTRSDPDDRPDFPLQGLLTNDLWHLITSSDLIVECTGDPIYATDMVSEVLKYNLPVVTLDPALHITSGSYLNTLGWFSESEGDQPGCLAAWAENLTACGFTPLVYGNIKGYQKLSPDPRHMKIWARRLGISLREATANTDGTKLQIEQCLVANWFGADIACEGMIGLDCKTIEDGAYALSTIVEDIPISDYLTPQYGKPGVFILANHQDPYQQSYLQYLKLGSGPYLLSTNQHLCHLEVIKTIRRWAEDKPILMNNGISTPSISVAAIAKHDINAGESIDGIGSFDTRGITVKINDRPDHVPIGLIHNVFATDFIEQGQVLTFSNTEIPDTLALRAWQEYHANP